MTSFLFQAGGMFLRESLRMLPAFLAGVAVAATIKTFQWDLRLRAHMAGAAGGASIPFAVFVGLFSPMCACGILPVVIPMAVSGVPLPPLLALLATSPLMSPDAFSITWAGLGSTFAWLKLVSAAGVGLMVGGVTYVLEKRSNFLKEIVRIRPVYGEDGRLAPAAEIACANGLAIPSMTVRPRPNRFLFFLDRARDMGLFIGRFLLLAIALQVVLELTVPLEAVRVLLGGDGFSTLVGASLLGVPLPAHQVPVVPILRGLLDLGMDPGAAAAFLVAGPVTSIPALVVLWGMFRRRLFFLYLGLCLAGAVITGGLFRLMG